MLPASHGVDASVALYPSYETCKSEALPTPRTKDGLLVLRTSHLSEGGTSTSKDHPLLSVFVVPANHTRTSLIESAFIPIPDHSTCATLTATGIIHSLTASSSSSVHCRLDDFHKINPLLSGAQYRHCDCKQENQRFTTSGPPYPQRRSMPYCC